ncbi:MAG: hypothetical protein JRH20_09975 [Deltaproteobacteria bacterium]|nr:hypothetical protein [Deltaproteobacteria bacterium]
MSQLCLILAGIFGLLCGLPTQAQADDGKGYATGWSHEVRVFSHRAVGLEAGISRESWYAKGLEFDRKGQHQRAHDAFNRATAQFRVLLKQRPEDRKRIQGWILKAQQQLGVSYTLKNSQRYRRHLNYNTYYRRYRYATNCHLKWLAIRAFGLPPPPRLLADAFKSYHAALKLRSRHALSRLQLAALYHEVGKGRAGRAEFARAQSLINRRYSSLWKPLAYYYTVSGQRKKAFEYLRKTGSSSWRRREVLRSNYFDRLRGDPRFTAIVGTP